MGDAQDEYYGEPSEKFRDELRELKEAAWDFKQMIFAAYTPDGKLLAKWLLDMTANVRAQIPALQFKPTHERLVAAIAAADAALKGK